MSPINADAAMDMPTLNPMLSKLSRIFFRGTMEANSVYPGRNRTKGMPIIARKMLEGKRVVTRMSRMATMLIRRNTLGNLILTVC